jgi:enoyl-CoA hydratase/3-hydroxyacyl-CoA dehydrogenase
MDAADVGTVAVLGAGTVGHGIAELAALAGFEVRLRDIESSYVERGYDQIRWSVDRLAERDQLPADEAAAALDRISAGTDLAAAVEGADLLIEAVPDRRAVKRDLYGELSGLAPGRAPLATASSAFAVSELAGLSDRPERFCGLHFFVPPVRVPLVEVVPGDRTDVAVVELLEGVIERLGREPLRVPGDPPGFVVERVVLPAVNEAGWLVQEAVADPVAVDASARFELGLPAGPCETADRWGLDRCERGLDRLAAALGEGYEPAPAITDRVDGDDLGRKTGAGFHDYADGTPRLPGSAAEPGLARRLLAPMAREVAALDAADVVDPATADHAVELALGAPAGPGELADRHGLDRLLARLEERAAATGHPRYGALGPLRARVEAGRGFGAADPAEPGDAVGLDLDRDAGVARLVIDRPHRTNAVDADALDAFDAALDRALETEAVRALVVTGAGSRAFSVGLDLEDELLTEPTAAEAAALARRGQHVFGRLERCGLPVVAAIDGACLAGGLAIAACADLRVATARAEFGATEHNVGLSPAWGTTQRLPRIVGEGRAKALLLTGERYDADTLREWGFLTEVVDGDRSALDRRVRALAGSLAAGPPVAQRRTLRAVHRGREGGEAGFALEAESFGHVATTADAAAGVRASRRDEAPEFEGR